ncbi:MAG TPA: hypothetical protein PKL29_09245 [Methanothrix sp.]|nr:hypothetical protein [Methanothrix sp.]
MKRLLLVLALIAVAISGCTEKGPADSVKSVSELKNLSQTSAENLTSYSVKSTMLSTWKLNAGENVTSGKLSTLTESTNSLSLVNLSGLKVHVNSTTDTRFETPSMPENTSTANIDFYLIGNSTYMNEGNGNWSHLIDPRSAEEVWGPDRNNQVETLANSSSLSDLEALGSEAVNGEDAYKLKIVPGAGDSINLYNTAFSIAAKITNYPMSLPSINRTELNETAKTEKTIWISKTSFLPVKYESVMSFTMTPEIVGVLDTSKGQMMKLNQSIKLGAISVAIETSDLYYDFDKPLNIIPPEQALSSPAVTPMQLMSQSGEQG